MIINSQRTIYGLTCSKYQRWGKEYIPLPNTTLNEKFDINPTDQAPTGVYPTTNYYAIGVGGTEVVSGLGGYSFSTHKPTDAALFEQVPFVMRKITNDLTVEEQSQYRFKLTRIVNGVEYNCYYLKNIPKDTVRDGIYKVNVSDGVSKLSPFTTNTDEYLNPVPRDPTGALFNQDETGYVTALSKAVFSLDINEIDELRNVLNILYGVDHNKTITEIGVCMGVDRVINNSVDAIAVQIEFHLEVELSAMLDLANTSDFIRSIELGGSEPLVT